MHASLITPLLTNDYPWFIAHKLEAEDDSQVQIFNNIHDPLSHYSCRIPELQGKRIRGCFHGWMILSNHPHNVIWSLWNPATSNSIPLPPLILKDGGDPNDHIDECCLSSPPNDPNSLLMLTRKGKPNFVFCRLDNCKRKELKWTEMAYGNQLKNLIREDGILRFLSCCNGKIYASSNGKDHDPSLIQVGILVKDKHVVINLSLVRTFPYHGEVPTFPLLKGTCTELFCIVIGFQKRLTLKRIKAVYLFKLDMSSMTWQKMKDLKGAILTVGDLEAGDYSVLYNPAIASELGGYIHFLGEKGKVIYSYHVKDRTISLSSMPCLVRTSCVSEWAMLECRRLKRDDDDDFGQEEDKNNEITISSDVRFNSTTNESHLLNIPLHILETIMEFCVGVEYLKFRATGKHCHLAAPLIKWSNKTTSTRWYMYSVEAPWLMVFNKHQGIMTFIDPMFGDKYFIKIPGKLICNVKIVHSRDGWLLLLKRNCKLVFFNPFTNHIIKLPRGPYLESYCFSAPPTSPDCKIVGFLNKKRTKWHVFIYFVARGGPWHVGILDFGADGPTSFRFPTSYGRDIYALCDNGGSVVFKDLPETYYSWETIVSKAPTSCTSLEKYFLVKCDQHVLLVTMSKLGESIKVFISNDRDEKWEQIYSLGRYMIYICDTTCLGIEAKTPKMENKIYFQRLHSKNGNIVFYSLETCRYHTFDGGNIQENFGDFFETKHHLPPHAWIEPRWS